MAKAQTKTAHLLGPGKVPNELLSKLLAKFAPLSANVVVGPNVGVDAAVIKNPRGRYLAVTSDPITLAADLLAYYCIHVNANDLAVMGAEPEFMTAVCLLPVGTEAKLMIRLGTDLARYSRGLNINVIGGHSEVTPTVTAPVMIGTMLGRVTTPAPISAAGARVGDVVVMTKQAGLEATAIIARERAERLLNAGLTSTTVRRARRLLFQPGISILPEARVAAGIGCSAMHDATEGGLVTALWEMASASQRRIQVDLTKIPVLPITTQICRVWDIDPLRVISSGSILVSIRPRMLHPLLASLKERRITATVIGEVTSGKPGVLDMSRKRLLSPVQDHILKIYQ